jgi:hypothetical protein
MATTVLTSLTPSLRQTRVRYLRSRSSCASSHPRRNANYKLFSLLARLALASTCIRAGLLQSFEQYFVIHSRYSSRRRVSCIKLIDFITRSSSRSIHARSHVVKLPKRLGMRLRMMLKDWGFPLPGRHLDGVRRPPGGLCRGTVTRELKRLVSTYTSNSWISEKISSSHRADHQKIGSVPSRRPIRNSFQTS